MPSQLQVTTLDVSYGCHTAPMVTWSCARILAYRFDVFQSQIVRNLRGATQVVRVGADREKSQHAGIATTSIMTVE